MRKLVFKAVCLSVCLPVCLTVSRISTHVLNKVDRKTKETYRSSIIKRLQVRAYNHRLRLRVGIRGLLITRIVQSWLDIAWALQKDELGSNVAFQTFAKEPCISQLLWRICTVFIIDDDLLNRPFSSSKNSHFKKELKCKTFQVKMSFVCMKMKSSFHISSLALSLGLIQRLEATRKWPIELSSARRQHDVHKSNFALYRALSIQISTPKHLVPTTLLPSTYISL